MGIRRGARALLPALLLAGAAAPAWARAARLVLAHDDSAPARAAAGELARRVRAATGGALELETAEEGAAAALGAKASTPRALMREVAKGKADLAVVYAFALSRWEPRFLELGAPGRFRGLADAAGQLDGEPGRALREALPPSSGLRVLSLAAAGTGILAFKDARPRGPEGLAGLRLHSERLPWLPLYEKAWGVEPVNAPPESFPSMAREGHVDALETTLLRYEAQRADAAAPVRAETGHYVLVTALVARAGFLDSLPASSREALEREARAAARAQAALVEAEEARARGRLAARGASAVELSEEQRRRFLAPLTAASSAPARGSDSSIYWREDLAQLVSIQSTKGPRIARVLGSLGLAAGQSVLDVGAGTGQQALALAAAVGPSGRVDATEISPMLVEHIERQARERGLGQLRSVLVSKNGVDPFYGRERYDLILLYNVFYHLRDQAGLLRGLKKALKPGGRLVVVDPESRGRQFSLEDVTDWPGLLADLRAEPPGGPFGKRLGALRALLPGGDPADGTLRRSVVYQLNGLLGGDLFSDLVEGERFKPGTGLTEEERPYADWSLRRMTHAGFPASRPLSEIDRSEFEELRMFNKLLLIARYRRRLVARPYHCADRVAEAIDPDLVASAAEAAGYRLLAKTPLDPYEAVWTFAARP